MSISTSTPASTGKTWALKCATGLDCRAIGLSDAAAAALLDRLDAADGAVIDELLSMGAKGTPKLPKAIREANHRALYDGAMAAGAAAAEACVPTPMIVQQRLNPLDDNSPVVKEWEPVAAGVCGFAWVTIFPGNSSFARWLAKEGLARKAYRGGMEIYISAYSQSYERKMAHAQAAAKYLREHGIEKAYSGGRLD